MGGVGIASPQDTISAVFSNPATMCFGPFCPSTRADAALVLFKPDVRASVKSGEGSFSAASEEKIYPIPAAGISTSFGRENRFRFGLAAYGVSGLGVDYRDTVLDSPDTRTGFRRASGTFTDLQRLKAAPALAYQISDKLSVGASLHLHRASLDLGNGPKDGYAVGFQPGVIFRPTESISLGLTYVSAQEIDHKNVTDFDGDGQKDTLTLEAPQWVGGGIAWEPLPYELLFEFNVKWINWSDAKGYKDFDWNDQWVFNVGAQYKVTERWTLRAGYNYAESVVEEHDGWNGAEMVDVQGNMLPRYFYETFRIVGFPAIVEQHLTLGVGYEIKDRLHLDVSFMHAFENSVTETGTDLTGQPAELESELSENSLGISLSWIF
jgi:long-chain fatty acid transport protein